MGEIQKLVAGIVLVIVGISMLLSSSSFLPWLGGVLGLGGVALVVLGLRHNK